MNTFVKQFQSIDAAREERLGHVFFCTYCQRAPKLLSGSTQNSELSYENLSLSTEPVTDVINRGEHVELESLFEELSTMTNTYATKRTSEGGTQKFFIQRVSRLEETVSKLYLNWLKQHPSVNVQGIALQPQHTLIETVRHEVKNFSNGLCAPSQGDFHERNIFADGTIVDFEAAGWNLVATDIATFLWHTLFAGNYFGPLYGKWATDDDTAWLKTQVPPFTVSNDAITTFLAPQRVQLAQQYLNAFVSRLNTLDPMLCHQVSMALCFRLLTTFPLQLMSPEDRHISFALANYFFQQPFPASVEHLLNSQVE